MHWWHLLFILLSGISLNLMASTQDEINHLLKYVESTQCQYERNGEMHNGVEAVEHINRKYDYFKKKIDSSEDFIKYSATRSKLSGNYYMIHCDGQGPVRSQDWLLQELRRYRDAKKQ